MLNFDFPHRRKNPLTGEWVLVSPHRARRPWLGQVEKVPAEILPQYDPSCYLCPGNSRAGGKRNPLYTLTFTFDNDYPALLEAVQQTPGEPGMPGNQNNALFAAQPESGICRVVCFSPRHDLSLPELTQEGVAAVIHTWTEETRRLCGMHSMAYVQVFENKGEMMGCSNPHPHSQIWASSQVPNQAAVEGHYQSEYLRSHGTCLLCDYLEAERKAGDRLVGTNEDFSAVVPFWAVWPFEILLISHRHIGSLTELTTQEVTSLAELMQQVTTRYDNLFEISFPYSMGFHQVPVESGNYPGWHFHAHYYPPLLRSASVRKFMVGYEMLAMPQRDLTPETAAERLRSLENVHYKAR